MEITDWRKRPCETSCKVSASDSRKTILDAFYVQEELEETTRILWELEKSGYRVRSEVESSAPRNSFTCGSSAY